jgi:hypothetical protein
MAAVAVLAIWTYTGSPGAGGRLHPRRVCRPGLAPAAGSLVNELFPTSVRASAAGWSLAAGVAVTGLVASGAGLRLPPVRGSRAVTFVPALLMVLFWLLPETAGGNPRTFGPARQPSRRPWTTPPGAPARCRELGSHGLRDRCLPDPPRDGEAGRHSGGIPAHGPLIAVAAGRLAALAVVACKPIGHARP